jgi:ribonuclease-3
MDQPPLDRGVQAGGGPGEPLRPEAGEPPDGGDPSGGAEGAHIPHAFERPELLELALTHASHARGADNERLEFLGDAALDLIVAEELFQRLPDTAEGELTELKASVVARRTLAEAARALSLEKTARLGGGMRRSSLPMSVLANLYEAVLGAVYLDGGYEAARTFALATLRTHLDQVRARVGVDNPKQSLQHLCQARWGRPPHYVQLTHRGQAHARAFLVAARVEGRTFPSAWGRTVKEAERWAAHEALLVLQAE